MHDLSVLNQIDIVQPGYGDRFDLSGVWTMHGSDLKLTKELFFSLLLPGTIPVLHIGTSIGMHRVPQCTVLCSR